MLPINATIFKMETSGFPENPFTINAGMGRKLVVRPTILKMHVDCVIRSSVHQEGKI